VGRASWPISAKISNFCGLKGSALEPRESQRAAEDNRGIGVGTVNALALDVQFAVGSFSMRSTVQYFHGRLAGLEFQAIALQRFKYRPGGFGPCVDRRRFASTLAHRHRAAGGKVAQGFRRDRQVEIV